MRLIDADAIVLPKGFFEKVTNVPKFYDWLDTQPTIDAVEVVRCGECKLWSEAPNSKHIREYHRCRFSECLTRDNDYCSKGERREDEEENKS